jgi:hypothetical protein
MSGAKKGPRRRTGGDGQGGRSVGLMLLPRDMQCNACLSSDDAWAVACELLADAFAGDADIWGLLPNAIQHALDIERGRVPL